MPSSKARIRTFELAFRMQTEAADVFDLSREPKAIRELYGNTHAWPPAALHAPAASNAACASCRSGAAPGSPGTTTTASRSIIASWRGQWDKPIAAFLTDLKQRGLFDSTLVLWGGEFGRTPVAELPQLSGRDHNHYGFTCGWPAAASRAGTVYGATDEFGFRAVENRCTSTTCTPRCCTCSGFDHDKLTYRYAGRDFRLTDVHGKVIRELIA